MKKKNPSLYHYGWKQGWTKNTIWPNSKRRSEYTWEEWAEAVHLYGNASTMRKKNPALYLYGYRKGWSEITEWPNRKGRYGYSVERLKKEVFNRSRKFHSRGEFCREDECNYEIALRRGWLDEMYWLEPKENPFKDRINYIYVYLFKPQNTFYVGETYHGSNRDWYHRRRGPVCEFAKQNNIEVPKPIILEDNLDRLSEVRKQEHYWKLHYISLGYNTLNKGKTGEFSGSLGSASRKWTREKCYKVALLCLHPSEMAERFVGAYGAALRNGWLKDYTWFTVAGGKPKTVLQYTKNGRLVKRWDSIILAARSVGVNRGSNICSCCKGKKKSAYGYVWRYSDKLESD